MEKKFKLGVIGAGYMATSIIKGAIRSNFININDILEYSITYLYNDTNQLIGLYFNDKPYFYNRDLTGNINSRFDWKY